MTCEIALRFILLDLWRSGFFLAWGLWLFFMILGGLAPVRKARPEATGRA